MTEFNGQCFQSSADVWFIMVWNSQSFTDRLLRVLWMVISEIRGRPNLKWSKNIRIQRPVLLKLNERHPLDRRLRCKQKIGCSDWFYSPFGSFSMLHIRNGEISFEISIKCAWAASSGRISPNQICFLTNWTIRFSIF